VQTSVEGQQGVTTNGRHVDRVISRDVLQPIPGPKPAGDDVRGEALWVKISAARPKMDVVAVDDRWALANPRRTDWSTFRTIVEQALCTRTKDLELAMFLTEACSRIHGFAGVRDGLWAIGSLIDGFIDNGLHPEAIDGDFVFQYGKLNWLNEKFPDIIREIPITKRPEPGTNYSLVYRDESRRQGGAITAAEFDAAAMAGSADDYVEMLAVIDEVDVELGQYESIAKKRYGEESVLTSAVKEALEECRIAVQSILAKLGADSPLPKEELTPAARPEQERGGIQLADSDAWSECERMARSGNIDRALANMTALAAAEPNGRIRFQRKLLLADLCLQTNRKKLGTSILQELNEIVVRHKLEEWETSEIVGGVWARLVRCYRDRAAGTADDVREAEFYLKLSRLDPWQALACGEPAKKD